MIPVSRSPEPDYFDEEINKPGAEWLAAHGEESRPRPFWSRCVEELHAEFRGRCGYAAMALFNDYTVDHYVSVKERRDLSYEWGNYRLASSSMNSRKKNADETILDPFEVCDGWFEIVLPSLQLRCTSAIPASHREKAEYTIRRLKLRDGETVIRWRTSWYQSYRAGKLTLEGLRDFAPLIAEAVEREKRNAN